MSEQGTSIQGHGRSRALTLYRPAPGGGAPGHERPEAPFLAQLIACDRRLPAYRSARMAEPQVAALAYGEAAALFARRPDELV